MGNSKTKINSKTVEELRKDVNFSPDEIRDWYKEYNSKLRQGESELTRDEFKKVYNSMFIGDATEFAEHVFRTFDHDRNGTVNFREFLVGLFVSSCDDPETKLRWAFKLYDIDGNGFISQDEMRSIVKVT